jgi:AbrB family looped-hinge helix DNA binding protein
MSRVTSKLQVTLPKAIADRFGIRPGDEIEWEPAGDSIRVLPPSATSVAIDIQERLRIFDAATRRQQEREDRTGDRQEGDVKRGWTREELYLRGGPR